MGLDPLYIPCALYLLLLFFFRLGKRLIISVIAILYISITDYGNNMLTHFGITDKHRFPTNVSLGSMLVISGCILELIVPLFILAHLFSPCRCAHSDVSYIKRYGGIWLA